MELKAVGHDASYVSLTVSDADEPILLACSHLLPLRRSLECLLRQWPQENVTIRRVDDSPVILVSEATGACSSCGTAGDDLAQLHYVNRDAQNGIKWRQCKGCTETLLDAVDQYVAGREAQLLGDAL